MSSHHDIGQNFAERLEPHLERGIFLDMLAQAGGDLPQLGFRAGFGNAQNPPPGDHRRAHEHLGLRIDSIFGRDCLHLADGLFIHRLALAGQDGFIER